MTYRSENRIAKREQAPWRHLRSCLHPWRWRSLLFLVGLLIVSGCRSEKDEPSGSGRQPAASSSQADADSTDNLARAKRLLRARDLDGAAEAVSQSLVQDPDNADAKLVAAEVEAARGNHETAAELAGTIDMRSRLGKRAVEIQFQQLLQLGRTSEAADVLLAAIKAIPGNVEWHHHAWGVLNRVGRTEDASAQAEMLCRAGAATEAQLVSLLSRNDSFPFALAEGKDPAKHFEPGLGMARWYFTQRDYRRALKELSSEYQEGFQTQAACALYGRLLSETQNSEEISAWHSQCGPDITEYADYWAALGTYFFDRQQFEASARALMEALIRDPTDDFSAHRLARALDAVNRKEDAEQVRHRGVLVAQLDEDAEKLQVAAVASDVRRALPQKLLELGRPYEALGWTLLQIPANAVNARAEVRHKLMGLNRSNAAEGMAAEMWLLGINRTDFQIDTALNELRHSATTTKRSTAKLRSESLATPRLVNVADQVGLQFQWYQDVEINLASIPIHEMMGGGIAVIDYDLDGWPDVYLGQGSGDPPTDTCTRSNVLFRNLETQFKAVTDSAGAEDFHYSTGVAVGDVNQDGFPDMFLGSLGHNRLLINNGDGTFRDATAQWGDVADQFTTSLAIGDINGDALPDLFEAVYLEMAGGFDLPKVDADGREMQPTPLSFYAQTDRWFENKGDGHFQVHKISEETAIAGTSLGVVVTDFDSSGANQVFVGNDARPNHFLVQAGDNKFRNAADAKGVANGFSGEANACMGIAPGDFNRDGTLDMYITNFSKESANHFLQSAGGGFTDSATRYGLDVSSLPYIAFGTKAVDMDRNGWLDLIVANGHVFDRRHLGEDFRMPPQLLMNRGSSFEQVSVEDDSGYWDGAYLGRAIATTDYDRNGEVDFLVGHLDQPLALLENQTRSPGHWIQLELIGTSSERDAIGARVVLTLGNETLTGWVTAGDGYLCSDEPMIDFGLGTHRRVDQLEVFWPSGKRETFDGPPLDHRYLVIEGDSESSLWQREIRSEATTKVD